MAESFGVAELSAELGVEPTIARTKLRAAGIEKTDGKYSWTKKADFQAIVKQLKGDAKPAAKADKSPSKKDAGAAPENKAGKKGRVAEVETGGLKKKAKK